MGTVTGKTKHLEAPDGSGSIDIRALGFLALDMARDKRMKNIAELARAIGDIKWPTPTDAPAEPDPLTGYDRLTLLKHGIVSWSYGEKVEVEELDDPTAEWAAREILAYSVPSESAVGKPSSRSTVTLATHSIIPPQTNGS